MVLQQDRDVRIRRVLQEPAQPLGGALAHGVRVALVAADVAADGVAAEDGGDVQPLAMVERRLQPLLPIDVGEVAFGVAHDEQELDPQLAGAPPHAPEVGVLRRGKEGVHHLEPADAQLAAQLQHAGLVDLPREEHPVQRPGGERYLEVGRFAHGSGSTLTSRNATTDSPS